MPAIAAALSGTRAAVERQFVRTSGREKLLAFLALHEARTWLGPLQLAFDEEASPDVQTVQRCCASAWSALSEADLHIEQMRPSRLRKLLKKMAQLLRRLLEPLLTMGSSPDAEEAAASLDVLRHEIIAALDEILRPLFQGPPNQAGAETTEEQGPSGGGNT